MTWFSFPGGWGDYNLNGLAEKELAATGAHGYATQAEADAHVNATPTALQQTLLSGFKAASLSPVGAGATGVLQTPSSTGGVSGALSNLLGGSSSNWLLRIAEMLLGLALIAVGVAKLTNAVPAATKIARTLG